MDNRAKIAACLICTLAACMRDCKACPFKAGLEVKERLKRDQENTEFMKKEIENHETQ